MKQLILKTVSKFTNEYLPWSRQQKTIIVVQDVYKTSRKQHNIIELT